ncbi:DNA-3-methyladenine glycosylase 2 family protein [Aeromicrobium phragmitis]|uniref:DNA-3-methyladenine glycosylase 2 family protein n=1 Tax=Aeromicrobium phragmitis TaxID=2478914 RepID=A0A3L8PHX2_9ACTN|nr:DNA-3-methyladenine glycosylase [Aeromicrobium phragmitis]RLV54744.1 DNA-3-methyladenine glycosylase 2 family protein [Aeromicrobium phragmitis]
MSGDVVAVVELPSVYHLQRSLAPLRRGPGDPALRFESSVVWRATLTPAGPASLRLTPLASDRIRVEAWGDGAAWASAQAPRLLGIDDRPEEFGPDVAWLAELHRRTPGLRLPRTDRVMEALIPAILEQKVLGVDAFAAWRRLLQRHGEPAPGPAPEALRVPLSAEGWARLPAWEWHRAGVTPERYRTAQAVARVGERFESLSPDRLPAALRAVPGIGRWTVAETVMRAFGDADAVPWGDYHLGRIVGTAFCGRALEDEAKVAELLAPFAPHRYRALRLLTLHTRIERRGPRRSRVDVRRL